MAKKPVSVTLPVATLSEAKSLRKKHGFRTMSQFFRAVLSELDEKKLAKEPVKKQQISFRLDGEAFEKISKLAKRLHVSVAEIVRLQVAQASKIPDQRFAELSQKQPAKKAKKRSRKRKVK